MLSSEAALVQRKTLKREKWFFPGEIREVFVEEVVWIPVTLTQVGLDPRDVEGLPDNRRGTQKARSPPGPDFTGEPVFLLLWTEVQAESHIGKVQSRLTVRPEVEMHLQGNLSH